MRRLAPVFLLLALVALIAAPSAGAAKKPKLPKDVVRQTFKYPIDLKPGTNIIKIRFNVPKPSMKGYIVRFKPGIEYRNGKIPRTDFIHLHHGVWLRFGGQATPGYPAEIFSATGEELTIVKTPRPYGYPIAPTDTWVLNDMIHDLTNRGAKLNLVWTLDIVPANTPTGRMMKPVHTMWNDVEQGKIYPVFDTLKGQGSRGKVTFPDQVPNAYAGDPGPRNQIRIDSPQTLVACFGHLHPGGLYTDLRLRRGDRSKLLFRSEANYFGKRPPVSWDMSMTRTKDDWRVRLLPGDVVSVHATYETKRGSWYESMGIMPCAVADGDTSGKNPFQSKLETRGVITHGHLKQNDHWGAAKTGIVDPTKLPNGTAPNNVVRIGNFKYEYGDLRGSGAAQDPPTIPQGSSLEFVNKDTGRDIFHTITSCKAPCNLSTGMGYPLASGTPVFDSGQLGFGPAGFTIAAQRDNWSTPKNLSPGTYTYLCRAHPFMRGAFRVVAVNK
jgi:hypothetical protein